MSREIKFRVWDNVDYMSSPFTLTDIQFKKIGFGSSCPVMQFTGLKDKNGKEIYEGDILKCDEYTVTIEYKGGQFVGYNENLPIKETQNRNWLQWSVIGNVYENPELLKN